MDELRIHITFSIHQDHVLNNNSLSIDILFQGGEFLSTISIEIQEEVNKLVTKIDVYRYS